MRYKRLSGWVEKLNYVFVRASLRFTSQVAMKITLMDANKKCTSKDINNVFVKRNM